MSDEERPVDPSSLVPHPSSLTEYGFVDPERAAAALRSVARQLPDPLQALRSVEMLLDPLSRSPDPDMALANLAHWASRLGTASSTFATLQDDPRLLDDLLRLFGSSQYLADGLLREPTAYTLLLEPDEVWR